MTVAPWRSRSSREPREGAGHLARVPEHAGEEVPVHVLARVAGVGGQHEVRSLARAHPEGLVAGRVAVGRDEHDRPVAEDVVLAVDRLVGERMIEVRARSARTASSARTAGSRAASSSRRWTRNVDRGKNSLPPQ